MKEYLTITQVSKRTGYSTSYYRRKFLADPSIKKKLGIEQVESGLLLIPAAALTDPLFKKKVDKSSTPL